jgi:hypothetical protein
MRIAAVVVNYHSGPLLGDCLRRLLASPTIAELALVDNGSRPGEIDALIAELADRRLIKLELLDNPGFAVACNRGARATHSPYLLMINPDCLIDAAALEALSDAAVARSAESFGAIGALLVDRDGRVDKASARRDPTPWRAVVTALGLERLWPTRGVHQPIAQAAAQPVEAISGALMLLRREAFAAVRGFDEGYFMHAEDLDLCRRLREQGYSVWLHGGVRVLHVKGVSSARHPYRVEYAKHRGLLRYFDKFDAPATPAPLRWAIRLAAMARLFLRLIWRAFKR